MPTVRVIGSRADILRNIIYPMLASGVKWWSLDRKAMRRECKQQYRSPRINRIGQGRFINWGREQSFNQQVSNTINQFYADNGIPKPLRNGKATNPHPCATPLPPGTPSRRLLPDDIMRIIVRGNTAEIVQRFKDAKKEPNPRKRIQRLAGAKCMATCYVQRQTAHGKDETRTIANLRCQLTKAGLYDAY